MGQFWQNLNTGYAPSSKNSEIKQNFAATPKTFDSISIYTNLKGQEYYFSLNLP